MACPASLARESKRDIGACAFALLLHGDAEVEQGGTFIGLRGPPLVQVGDSARVRSGEEVHLLLLPPPATYLRPASL